MHAHIVYYRRKVNLIIERWLMTLSSRFSNENELIYVIGLFLNAVTYQSNAAFMMCSLDNDLCNA